MARGRLSEDQPLPFASLFPIISYQKIVEVAMSEFARASGISTVCARLMGMYGPWQDPGQSSLVQRLVDAAVTGKPVNLENLFLANADDTADFSYIKDVARAIALLQTAEKLSYNVYNIGSGKLTSNREFVEAVESVVPGFKVDLPPGHGPFPSLPVMETKRLHADTGFSPKFDTQSAIQDYMEWLKAGNPK